MHPPTPTAPPHKKGTATRTYQHNGVWHVEIEAAYGESSNEMFGCPLRTVYNRAAKAIHTAAAPSPGTPVRVEFMGMRARCDGTVYALFREKASGK